MIPNTDDWLHLARFTLEHAEVGCFWLNPEGRFLYANAKAVATLGYSDKDLLDLTLMDVCTDFTPSLWTQLLKEVKSRGPFTFEMNLRTKTGDDRSMEMTVHQVSLSNSQVLCGYFQDVHELKHLQQLKNEFVSTVSHELRTPMTIVRESVSQLLDGLLGDVPPPQREALYVTLSGIDRLARIINDLLDVSKMEAGKATIKWDRLNLVELTREVVETFASRARERGLDLHASVPPHDVIVYGDYDRIGQVLTNLVGNAMKFSEKGTIEISLREHDRDIECAVSDKGMGIPPEDLNRVFNKFEQLNQPAVTGEKGTGLGLSICKGIVELHQGRIWAESQPGNGSTFTFTLPKRAAQELFQQRMSAELPQAAAAGGHITGVYFGIQPAKKADARKAAILAGWALDELAETLKTHGVRRTDILLKDAHGIWVALLGMTKKEAHRVVERILEAYSDFLEKNDLHGMNVLVKECNFPDEAKNDQEFMARLTGVKAS